MAKGPNVLGYTRHTVVGTMGRNSERRSKSPKSDRSSNRGLQLILVKLEWLVIASHYLAVNVSLLLAHTARQVTRIFFRWGSGLCQIRIEGVWGGLSRNKVSVGEPADRSPPNLEFGKILNWKIRSARKHFCSCCEHSQLSKILFDMNKSWSIKLFLFFFKKQNPLVFKNHLINNMTRLWFLRQLKTMFEVCI